MKPTWGLALLPSLLAVSILSGHMAGAVDSSHAVPISEGHNLPLVELAAWGMAGYATDTGFKVTSVAIEGTARRAGIEEGDTIIAINGGAVHSLDDIQRRLGQAAGRTVTLDLLHVYWHRRAVATLPPR